MAPIVHLVRHAQGFHNLCKENEVIHDPLLTPAGKAQCGTLHYRFPHHASVDLVVSSPIRRTLYTSLLGFEEEIKKKSLKVLALPELQETSELPCDTGSSPEDLAKEFANEPVDLHLVHHGWNVKAGKWAPDQEAIAERAGVAREWLRNRHEKEIVVVTHGGLLHYLTEDFNDKDRFPGTGWANTEFRSYRFDDSSPHEAHLIETEDSKTCRTSKPLDHNEVTQLKRTMSKEAGDKIDEANKEIKAEKEDGTEGAEQRAQHIQSKLQQNAGDDVETFL